LISACVLIRTQSGKFDEVVRTLNQIKEVKKVFPVLGRYDVVADIETSDPLNLGATVLRMSKIAGVVFTETLVEIQY